MIKIVTDSAVNLPDDVIKELDIHVVAGTIIFGNEAVLDYPDLTPDEFYKRLRKSERLPVNRDSSMRDFRVVYREILNKNPNAQILSIHISEVLATTINATRQAAAGFPAADIRVFDSRSVSLGMGLIVYEAARMARDGLMMKTIIDRLLDMRQRMETYVVLDTLEYLHKGGRVGSMQRLMGGIMGIKPILTIKDGQVQAHDQHRTRKKALDALFEMAQTACKGKSNVRMACMHGDCVDDANAMMVRLETMIKPETLLGGEIGPAVGVHTGPGALGVTWYFE